MKNITQTDLDGTQVGGSSEAWEEFYATRPWLNAVSCKRTSYHGNIRKHYAGFGYTYDAARDAFISPKPHNSWILDEDSCTWQAPIPYPDYEQHYYWDEDTVSWILKQ